MNILLFAAMNEADKKRRKLLANKNRASQYLVAKPLNQTAVKNGNNKKESRESKKIRDSNTTTLMLIVVITVRHNLTTLVLTYLSVAFDTSIQFI